MMKAGSFAFFLSVVFVLVSDFAWAQPSIPPSPPPTERQVLYQDVICVDADFTPDADESVTCDDFNPAQSTECGFGQQCTLVAGSGWKCRWKNNQPAGETLEVQHTILNAGAGTKVPTWDERTNVNNPGVFVLIDESYACYSALTCECRQENGVWVCRPKFPIIIYDLHRLEKSNINCDF
jgi:hypothetical protein